MERAGLTSWAKTPDELDEVVRRLEGSTQAGGRQPARRLFGVQPAASVVEEVFASTARAAEPAIGPRDRRPVRCGDRKVVVTGETRTRGADLIDCLIAGGDQVTIVDDASPGRPDLTYWAVPLADPRRAGHGHGRRRRGVSRH